MKVVEEVESGELSMNQAAKLYGIGGGSTIANWLKKHGRESVLPERVRVQMKDELRELEKLREENALLKAALASKELEAYMRKLDVEVLCEEYRLRTKKKIDMHALRERVKQKIAQSASGSSTGRTK
jgi:transposase-like protein